MIHVGAIKKLLNPCSFSMLGIYQKTKRRNAVSEVNAVLYNYLRQCSYHIHVKGHSSLGFCLPSLYRDWYCGHVGRCKRHPRVHWPAGKIRISVSVSLFFFPTLYHQVYRYTYTTCHFSFLCRFRRFTVDQDTTKEVVISLRDNLWPALHTRTVSTYPSFKGSVPVIVSVNPGPRTRTPHRCSVAYLTATVWSGKEGNDLGGKETEQFRFEYWSSVSKTYLHTIQGSTKSRPQSFKVSISTSRDDHSWFPIHISKVGLH